MLMCNVSDGIELVSSFQSCLPLFSLFLSSCVSEMERWLEDIRMAIDLAEQSISPNTDLFSAGLPDNSKFFYIYYIKQFFSFFFPLGLDQQMRFYSTVAWLDNSVRLLPSDVCCDTSIAPNWNYGVN